MTILVTGAAGFIGFHLTKRLLKEKEEIIGLDNMNDYYDVSLKLARKNQLDKIAKDSELKYSFVKANLEDRHAINDLFRKNKIKKVVNLAAQAGVRYSIKNPLAYINSNIVGFANILEECRNNKIENLIYASSSSVYGGNTNLPFNERQCVDHPVSLYAASKKSNELMAHSYSHLYGIPCTGLRFFTVYGPWGRPDMALFLFTKNIIEGKKIKVFNNGNMIRDFTYIDDIVESLLRLLQKPAEKSSEFNSNVPYPNISWAPHRIFNIGNSKPIELMDYIKSLEISLELEAKIDLLPMQPGDVPITASDNRSLEKWINFKPNTSIEIGIKAFVKWYKEFYKKDLKRGF